MNCYKVTVNTTSAMRDTFKVDGSYHDCLDGEVYVFAEDMEEAAKQIPDALTIAYVGCACPRISED